MANQLTRYATVATVDTADQGYFVGLSVHLADTGTAVIVAAIDQTRAYGFVLPFRVVVGNIVTEVTTGGGAGKKYGVGLYDVNGNLILETGTLDANTTQINSTSITAVTLEPGIYFHAQTSDSATTQLRTINFVSQEQDFLKQGSANQVGIASNTGSVGTLAATMGTLDGSTNRAPSYALYSR